MMKEKLELRTNYEFASLLFKEDEGVNLGTSIKVVELSKDDPRYYQIPEIESQIKEKYNKRFFFGWKIKRYYSNKEFNDASLLHMTIKTTFEPVGEECKTIYDEKVACELCGANRKQVGSLKLKKGFIPKKDIARTIAGEIVVSEKFADAYMKRELNGAALEPVLFEKGKSNYFQIIAEKELDLSPNTIAGINPFDLSTESEGEVYRCPEGHTIGLNLISEPYIKADTAIIGYDFFTSKQMIGVRRGLLRPEPLYFCSKKFREMVLEEKLKGFNFEIVRFD